jgi:outer membrane lipoprotein carrier protein
MRFPLHHWSHAATLSVLLSTLTVIAQPATPPAPSTAPATQTAATRPASKEFLAQLQDKLRSVNSVEADFVQEKTLAVFDHTITIKGHFALQKPDQLIWIVKEPVKYAVRVKGEEVRQWDQDTKNVQVNHFGDDPAFKAVSEQIQAWFLGNYKFLAETFDVNIESDKPLILSFTPKADSVAAKFIKHIQMTFGQDDLYINKLTLEEVGGDLTTIQFIQPQINKPIKDSTWEIPPHD